MSFERPTLGVRWQFSMKNPRNRTHWEKLNTKPVPESSESGGPTNEGFTLIELLIVIVVLGILAAVVIFALGGITGKTAEASCSADGATVATALQDFKTENPGVTASTTLLTTATDGGPYLQAWPSNSPHYFFEISFTVNPTTGLAVSTGPAGQVSGGGNYVAYTGPSSCALVQ